MKLSYNLFWSIIVLCLFAAIVTYYRLVQAQDFPIVSQVACDPEEEKCFVHVCDPAEESCSGQPDEDTTYYKILRKSASNFDDCDPKTCGDPVCQSGEKNCEVIFCSEEDNQSGDECSNVIPSSVAP